MKRMVAPILALVLMFSIISGCNLTPREQVANIQDTYISLVVSLNQAYDGGYFTDEQWDSDIIPVIRAGDAAIDALDAATAAGFPPDNELEAVRQVIETLRPIVLDYLASLE